MALPLIAPRSQWVDSNGDPLVGGTLEFQDPATSLPKDSYPTRDDADNQTNPNINPITLDGQGAATVFLRDGEEYKVILRDIDAIEMWTIDDVESPSGSPAAAVITLLDAGGYYVATDVEAALQELGAGTGAAIIGIADGPGNLSATDVEGALAEIFTKFASAANAEGASLVGVEDTAGSFTGTDVETVLAELASGAAGPTKHTTSTVSRDTTVTPADDAELFGWTLLPAEYYSITGFLKVDTVTSPGIDFRCVFQTDETFQASSVNYDGISENGSFSGNQTAATVDTIIDVPSSEIVGITITGTIKTHATNTSTVDFQWAQGSSSGVSVRLYDGSWITFRQIS